MNHFSGTTSLAADLFERHGTAVRGYLRRLTGQPALAEDLAQEVYLRVVRGADRYQRRGRERAWVLRIARNVFLDHRKHQARRPTARDPATDPAVRPVQVLRTDLNEALQRLDETDRDALLLCELGGLRYDEIATTLGLTVAGVRSRVYRARIALRSTLVPPEPLASFPRVRRRDDDD